LKKDRIFDNLLQKCCAADFEKIPKTLANQGLSGHGNRIISFPLDKA